MPASLLDDIPVTSPFSVSGVLDDMPNTPPQPSIMDKPKPYGQDFQVIDDMPTTAPSDVTVAVPKPQNDVQPKQSFKDIGKQAVSDAASGTRALVGSGVAKTAPFASFPFRLVDAAIGGATELAKSVPAGLFAGAHDLKNDDLWSRVKAETAAGWEGKNSIFHEDNFDNQAERLGRVISGDANTAGKALQQQVANNLWDAFGTVYAMPEMGMQAIGLANKIKAAKDVISFGPELVGMARDMGYSPDELLSVKKVLNLPEEKIADAYDGLSDREKMFYNAAQDAAKKVIDNNDFKNKKLTQAIFGMKEPVAPEAAAPVKSDVGATPGATEPIKTEPADLNFKDAVAENKPQSPEVSGAGNNNLYGIEPKPTAKPVALTPEQKYADTYDRIFGKKEEIPADAQGKYEQTWDRIFGANAPKEEVPPAMGDAAATEKPATETSGEPSATFTAQKEKAPLTMKGILERPKGPGRISRFLDEVKANIKEARDVSRYTPLKRVVNTMNRMWQQSDMVKSRVMSAIKKIVPNSENLEALTVYREAGGDKVKLQEWANNSTEKDAKKYFDALKIGPDVERGASYAGDVFGAFFQEGKDWGIFDKGLDPNTYVKHWMVEDLGGEKNMPSGGSGKMMKNVSSAQHRVFPTIFDAEQAYNKGLTNRKPKTTNLAEILGKYAHDVIRTIATRKALKDASVSVASDGRPLIIPYSGRPMGDAAAYIKANPTEQLLTDSRIGDGSAYTDYKLPNYKVFRNWKWTAPDENGVMKVWQGDAVVHPEGYKYFNNALGKSKIDEWLNAPGSVTTLPIRLAAKGIDRAQATAKQLTFAMSVFHWVQEGTHAVGHWVVPINKGLLEEIDPYNPENIDRMDHALQIGSEHKGMSDMRDGISKAIHIPGVTPLIEAMSAPLFERYIPNLKIRTYDSLLGINKKVYAKELESGVVTLDDLKYWSAKEANNAYGHLNYVDMARNPTLQHVLRAVLIAPDFLEARARFMRQAASAATLSKKSSGQALAIATLALTQIVACRILNYSKTLGGDGDYHWEHPFAVVRGNRLYAVRSVPSDVYDAATNTFRFVNGRMSPIIGSTLRWEMTGGKDYRGQEQSGKDFLIELGEKFVPMSLTGLIPGTQRNKDLNAIDNLKSSLGLRVSRNSPMTKFYEIVDSWKKLNGLPVSAAGTYPPSKYRDLRNALQDKDEVKALAAWNKLKVEHGGKMEGLLRTGFYTSLNKPITGSLANDNRFKKTLDKKELVEFELAKEQRRQTWIDFVRMLNHLKTPAPTDVENSGSDVAQVERHAQSSTPIDDMPDTPPALLPGGKRKRYSAKDELQ